jgi:hypothetical protein
MYQRLRSDGISLPTLNGERMGTFSTIGWLRPIAKLQTRRLPSYQARVEPFQRPAWRSARLQPMKTLRTE